MVTRIQFFPSGPMVAIFFSLAQMHRDLASLVWTFETLPFPPNAIRSRYYRLVSRVPFTSRRGNTTQSIFVSCTASRSRSFAISLIRVFQQRVFRSSCNSESTQMLTIRTPFTRFNLISVSFEYFRQHCRMYQWPAIATIEFSSNFYYYQILVSRLRSHI